MSGNVRGMNLGLLVVVVLAMVVAGCSKDKGPTKPSVDGVAPGAVVDLVVVSPTTTSVALRWTATGDDTTVGRASQYDIRYCMVEITAANWDSVGVVRVVGVPVPGEAGSRESFVVAGLSAGETYYFAVKVGDERPNWSGMSNVASGTTRAGSGWFALGTGMNGGVYALAVYNGQLIAGGYFTTAGGVSANCIAAWDGSSWTPLGAGMNEGVFALAVYDGQLTAGGYFTGAQDVIAHRIAAWDGSWWCPLGTGMVGQVAALAEYNGRLIAGGYFTTAGGVSANCIAAWDGSSWSPLGTGMDSAPIFEFGVYALAEYNGQLIAGGDFIRAGGVTVYGIAGWSY